MTGTDKDDTGSGKKTKTRVAIFTTGAVAFLFTSIVFVLELPNKVSEFYYSLQDKPITFEIKNYWQYQDLIKMAPLPDGKPLIKFSGIFQLTNKGLEDVFIEDLQLYFEPVTIDNVRYELRQTKYITDSLGYIIEVYEDERDLVENGINQTEAWKEKLSRRKTLPLAIKSGEQTIAKFLMDFTIFVDGNPLEELQIEDVKRMLPDLLGSPVLKDGKRRCVITKRSIKIQASDRKPYETEVLLGTYHDGCVLEIPSADAYFGLDVDVPTPSLPSNLVEVVVPTTALKLTPYDESVVTLGSAHQGDVFRYLATGAGHAGIVAFSGEIRFLEESAVLNTNDAPTIRREDISSTLCRRIAKAKANAVSISIDNSSSLESPSKIIETQIYLEKIYKDKLLLPIFQEYGIAPARYHEVTIICANETIR